jgi:hypothetical protein
MPTEEIRQACSLISWFQATKNEALTVTTQVYLARGLEGTSPTAQGFNPGTKLWPRHRHTGWRFHQKPEVTPGGGTAWMTESTPSIPANVCGLRYLVTI